MARIRLIPAVFLASTCACGSNEIVRVSLDEVVAPFESFILLVRDDQSLRAEALDRGDTLTMPLAYSDYSEVELTVLGYDEPLRALGVEPGVLEPGRGGRLPDPPTREVHVRVDGDEASQDWTPMTSLSPDLARFESPGIYNTGCVDFENSRAHVLGTRDNVGALIPFDDSAVLFTAPGGRDPGPTQVFRVDFDGLESIEVPGLNAVGPHHIAAGAKGSGGRLWITDRASIHVGELDSGFEWVAGSTVSTWPNWNAQIFVEPDPAGDRVYTLSRRREARVFDERTGTQTTLLPPLPVADCVRPTTERTLEGGGIFVHENVVHVLDSCTRRGIVRMTRGGSILQDGEIDDAPAGGEIVSGALTMRGPTLINTTIGQSAMHIFEDGRWSPDEPFNTQRVFAFTPFRQGWLVGGTFGFATQYADTGWCDSMPGVGAGEVVGDLRASDTHVFASPGRYGLSEGSESHFVIVLRAP